MRVISLLKIAEEAIAYYNELNKTHITDKIAEYLDKMTTKTFVSKLDFADEFASNRLTQLVEHVINTVSGVEYHAADISRDIKHSFG